MTKFICYPATNHEQVEGLAAADGQHFSVLTADWQPNRRGDGGVLVIQVEENTLQVVPPRSGDRARLRIR